MAVFITGATGFLGSYVVADFLTRHSDRLQLLVRSRSVREAEERLWRALQLHMDFSAFWDFRTRRIDICLGDLTRPGLGLSPEDRERIVESADSVFHCAASLHRKSEEMCLNVNLRGTLEVILLAQEIEKKRSLRRFSFVSTVAVSGERFHETVREDEAVRWNRPDSDPYGRTKKFAEHMVRRQLQGIPLTVFRPSAIIGDTRFPRTTQFDMVRAFAWIERLKILPLDPRWRIDIVPADYVSRVMVDLHRKEKPRHETYHVSAGEGALSYREIAESLRADPSKGSPSFAPRLTAPFLKLCSYLARRHPRWGLSRPALLVDVFKPHLVADTVFENRRIVEESGEIPAPFSRYAASLLRFARQNDFKYPYLPFPTETPKREVA
ncbi:MAG: SDR family oxidoreductase [bacterium]